MIFTPTQQPAAPTAPQNVRPNPPNAGKPAIEIVKAAAQSDDQTPGSEQLQTSQEVDDEKISQEAAAAELRRSTRLQGRKTPNMNERALEDAQFGDAIARSEKRKKAKRHRSVNPVPHHHMDTEEPTSPATSMDMQASPRARALSDGHETAQRATNEQMLEEIGDLIHQANSAGT